MYLHVLQFWIDYSSQILRTSELVTKIRLLLTKKYTHRRVKEMIILMIMYISIYLATTYQWHFFTENWRNFNNHNFPKWPLKLWQVLQHLFFPDAFWCSPSSPVFSFCFPVFFFPSSDSSSEDASSSEERLALISSKSIFLAILWSKTEKTIYSIVQVNLWMISVILYHSELQKKGLKAEQKKKDTWWKVTVVAEYISAKIC